VIAVSHLDAAQRPNAGDIGAKTVRGFLGVAGACPVHGRVLRCDGIVFGRYDLLLLKVDPKADPGAK